MRILALAALFVLAGCYSGNDNKQVNASASVDGITNPSGDKEEKKSSTGTLNTLIDLCNDTPYGADYYLTSNNYMLLSNPEQINNRTYRFKYDSLFTIDKTWGKKNTERVVTYSFPRLELLSNIKEQATILGYSYFAEKKDKDGSCEIYVSDNMELQLWQDSKGTYKAVLKSK